MIIPTVFSTTRQGFQERLDVATELSDTVHLDYMDGRFVDKTSLSVKDTPSLPGETTCDVHLMHEQPEDALDPLIPLQPDKVIIHVETNKAAKTVEAIRSHGWTPVLAKNPETDIRRLNHAKPDVEHVMLMGHRPGEENTTLYDSIENDIKTLSDEHTVWIDGGVDQDNIAGLRAAGATTFNIGSAIFNASHPPAAYKELEP